MSIYNNALTMLSSYRFDSTELRGALARTKFCDYKNSQWHFPYILNMLLMRTPTIPSTATRHINIASLTIRNSDSLYIFVNWTLVHRCGSSLRFAIV